MKVGIRLIAARIVPRPTHPTGYAARKPTPADDQPIGQTPGVPARSQAAAATAARLPSSATE